MQHMCDNVYAVKAAKPILYEANILVYVYFNSAIL